MVTVEHHPYSYLIPWTPTRVELPEAWMTLFDKLAQEEQSTSGVYVSDVRCNTANLGNLLHEWGLSWQAVMAGYLSGYSDEQIREANLEDVTTVLNYKRDAERYAHYIDDENLPILLTPPYQNVGALLIAVAMYYEGLQALQKQSNNEKYTGAKLTSIKSYGHTLLNIAKRLGMWHFKRTLEDLIEQISDPAKFAEERQVYEHILKRDNLLLKDACQLLMTFYHEATKGPIMVTYIPSGVAGMKRREQDAHTTATSQKTQLTGFDVVTFDVIVPTVSECYQAFGVLSHLGYIQDRVTNQIANPKFNGYSYVALGLILNAQNPWIKNLHLPAAYSCVWQIQIASHLMQSVANYGCIHPICYQIYAQPCQKDESLPIEQIWKGAEGRIFSTIKEGLTPDHAQSDIKAPIVVYDKQRKPIALQKGATALDFAFAIDHSLGERATEAIINNRKAPLFRELDASDIVEIRTSPETQAQDYWLDKDYARTQQARRQISETLDTLSRDRRGYKLLQSELEHYGYVLSPQDLGQALRRLLEQNHLGKLDNYLEKLEKTGEPPYTSDWAAQHIIKQIVERESLSTDRAIFGWVPMLDIPSTTHEQFPYQRLFCSLCQPTYPSDMKIVGLLRERGGELIIHKDGCSQLNEHATGHRSVVQPLIWQNQPAFRVTFFLTAQERKGLIYDITNILGRYVCDLKFINAGVSKDGQGQLHLTLDIYTHTEAFNIWQELSKIEHIITIELDQIATPGDIYECLQELRQQGTIFPDRTAIDTLWEEAVAALQPRSPILRNPFDISRPATAKMFFGRSTETKTMQRELCDGDNGKALILYGPRRSGKSSICKNFLERQVQPPFWHVLFSLQNHTRCDEETILMHLADEVCREFHDQLQGSAPSWQNYAADDPQIRFKQVLQSCIAQVPSARLVLALDEFGGALDAYEKGFLEYRFFSYWKELMNEITQLSLIFALPTSSHNLLISGEFSHTFSFAEYLPILFLDKESAQRLLVDPLQNLQVAVHPNTVAWATRLTGENPYYMTLIGQQLIHRLNREPFKQKVFDEDLQFVVDQIIEAGANQNFAFHRREIQSDNELRILEGMIELIERTKQPVIPLKKIAAHLKLPINITRQHLERLRNGLILEAHTSQEKKNMSSHPQYSFRIELVRRWLSNNRWFFLK